MTRLSNYFLPLIKENPVESKIISHRLMLRSGMIRQQSAGIYYWLPLGVLALEKIKQIVKNCLIEAGCMEVLMPLIQPTSFWHESGRYDAYGSEMIRMQDRHKNEMLFGPSNEEAITDIVRKNIFSYKSLPKNFFHIQWKFRDEIRPRFGVMRSREFLMKDGYSFDIDKDAAFKTYQIMFETYIEIFRKLGLTVIPVKADNGAIGGDISHEFHIVANTGESSIIYDKKIAEQVADNNFTFDNLIKLYASTSESANNNRQYDANIVIGRGIEVGHIFLFGNKYTKAMQTKITGRDGKIFYPYCGSYGIGISRLVGAIIEANHDKHGIVWPEVLSPFRCSLINLQVKDDQCNNVCNKLYDELAAHSVDVMLDDTEENVGSKFATHDLLGFPWQIIVGPKLVKENMVELKNRKTGTKQNIIIDKVVAQLAQ